MAIVYSLGEIARSSLSRVSAKIKDIIAPHRYILRHVSRALTRWQQVGFARACYCCPSHHFYRSLVMLTLLIFSPTHLLAHQASNALIMPNTNPYEVSADPTGNLLRHQLQFVNPLGSLYMEPKFELCAHAFMKSNWSSALPFTRSLPHPSPPHTHTRCPTSIRFETTSTVWTCIIEGLRTNPYSPSPSVSCHLHSFSVAINSAAALE